LVDSNGVNWHDARLREPEHYVAEKDGFTLDIERLDSTTKYGASPTSEVWSWRVSKPYTATEALLDRNKEERYPCISANGIASSKSDCFERVNEAIALLRPR
jgi:hypothetical protein